VQKAKDALGPFPDCPELTVLRQAAEYVLTRTK
jgi:hypothetical protein